MSSSLGPLLCVFGIALGQLLFKFTAESLTITGSYLHPSTVRWLLTALIVYGVTTLGWINTLQQGTLSRIYPWMAVAFVIVPLLSNLFLSERLSLAYWLGITLIVICVTIATSN